MERLQLFLAVNHIHCFVQIYMWNYRCVGKRRRGKELVKSREYYFLYFYMAKPIYSVIAAWCIIASHARSCGGWVLCVVGGVWKFIVSYYPQFMYELGVLWA